MEKGLQAGYENINWQEINGTIQSALAIAKLDSLEHKCEETLKAIEQTQTKTADLSNLNVLPFPDESLDNLKKQREKVEIRLKEIRTIRSKKVIKL